MTIDGPDYGNAVIATRTKLGAFAVNAGSETVALPSTVTAIWIWLGAGVNNTLPFVTGTVTGIHYPVFVVGQDPTANIPPFVALVDPAIDPSVTVAWSTGPAAAWWVVGDTSFRIAGALQFVLTARSV